MSKKLKSSFSFGEVSAEVDPLLSATYIDNGDFTNVVSPNNPRSFIIGRTGSGKSALFEQLRQKFPDKVINIKPENLMFRYITNLDAVDYLSSVGVRLDIFFKALWKHIIVVETLRHVYRLDNPTRQLQIWNNFVEGITRRNSKQRARQYVEQYEDHFWCETDERIKKYSDSFQQNFIASSGIDVKSIKGTLELENKHTQAVEREKVERFQRIVNEYQMPALEDIILMLSEEALNSSRNVVYIVIDDLDRPFVEEESGDLAMDLIRCLFEAVVDLKNIKYLKVLVALRNNIFHQFDYGRRRRSGQEEKIQGLSIQINWNDRNLRSVLESRVEEASKLHQIEPPLSLSKLLPRENKNAGDPVRYILSRTLMKPRDAILFLNKCSYEAIGKDRISWEDIKRAERSYSIDRLNALRDEWKDPYLAIDKIFPFFRNTNYRMSRKQISLIIDNLVVELMGSPKYEGAYWLEPLSNKLWQAGNPKWHESYGPIIELLYIISFLGIGQGQNKKATYSYDDPNVPYYLIQSEEEIYFEIHPAFRRALDIKEIPSTFK